MIIRIRVRVAVHTRIPLRHRAWRLEIPPCEATWPRAHHGGSAYRSRRVAAAGIAHMHRHAAPGSMMHVHDESFGVHCARLALTLEMPQVDCGGVDGEFA